MKETLCSLNASTEDKGRETNFQLDLDLSGT